MTYEELYQMISNVEGKNANVWITTKESGKRYKMNLHITPSNILKMKSVGTRGLGYNVMQMHLDKWLKVELCNVPRGTKC